MSKKKRSAYTKAGVDIEAATKAVKLIKKHIRLTYNKYVLQDIGHFGGFLDVSFLKEYDHPVLVFSTDGIGTKMIVAEEMHQYPVGQCIVNHCINDILCCGAEPIAFINYIASAKLQPEVIEQIVAQMSIACKTIGIPIITGETAEMPDVYQKGRHDLVGGIMGVVEKENIIDGSKIKEGDILIGLPSTGLHTNGYSLARKAFFETLCYTVNTYVYELGCTIGEELLKIHRSYFKPITPLYQIHVVQNQDFEIHGIAHITGGGFYDNIGRLIPDGLCAEISYQWKIPPIFQMIQKAKNVSNTEMRRVFNLGIGMVLIIPKQGLQVEIARKILSSYDELDSLIIGEIKKTRSKKKKVVFTY